MLHTVMAEEHQAPDNPVAQQRCKMQVHSVGYRAVNWPKLSVCNLKKSRDWNLHQQCSGTVAFVLVFGIEPFAAAVVVVQWLLVSPPVIVVDRPGIQLSADASALVSLLFAIAAVYPVPAPAVVLSRDVVFASHLKTSEPRAQDQV